MRCVCLRENALNLRDYDQILQKPDPLYQQILPTIATLLEIIRNLVGFTLYSDDNAEVSGAGSLLYQLNMDDSNQ